jgi:hypothetical protein
MGEIIKLVLEIYTILKKSEKKVEFDEIDQKSVGKWIANNQERVLVHQEFKEGPPQQDLILSLQALWQLAKMVEMSHNRPIAMDSTFAPNKYDVIFSYSKITISFIIKNIFDFLCKFF